MTSAAFTQPTVQKVLPSKPALGGLPRATVPGYTLRERLGSGGFGEVWKAEAPGGIFKAVKLVYGELDDSRAKAELRALERIKQVRHPFLLTLERIELVEGRLAIVTELADTTLKARFDACRKAGLKGIPRDELLGYLRDAAEALDFMAAEHQLQHLDIKPENLLLIGNHVKVADFGLTKDLRESIVSEMPGVTPLYSPPEVFEGRPTRHSDQYSLAIVYQAMLTGVPPFQGRNASQLMTQHLHGTPSLSPLPPGDRAAVGRALSRDPQRRFETCRELIENLLRRPGPASARPTAPRRAPSKGSAATADQAAARNEARQAVLRHFGLPDSLPVKFVPCPPLKPCPTARTRAVVFVGIGGVGGQLLLTLRNRLRSRFGSDAWPAWKFLYIDTDRAATAAAMRPKAGPGLPEDAVLEIPLKPSPEYRGDASRLLEAIDRRWLYNVPRSLCTEGIRPLGRLALLDHAARVRLALKRMIQSASDNQAAETTAASTGWTVERGCVDVVVVGATTGGTGSGCVADVARAAQAAIIECGLPADSLRTILLHGTSRAAGAADLAVANTLACLAEFRAATGDDTNGRPAASDDDDRRLLTSPHFVHLGDGLDEAGWWSSLKDVVEYMYRSGVSPAAGIMDGLRNTDPTWDDGLRLRSFSIRRLVSAVQSPVTAPFNLLCRTVVAQWRNQPCNEELHALEGRVAGELQELLLPLGLESSRLQQTIAEIVKSPAADRAVKALASRTSDETESAQPDAFAPVIALLGQRLGSRSSVAGKLREGLLKFLNAPGIRMARTTIALQQATQRVNSLLEQIGPPARTARQDVATLTKRLAAAATGSAAAPDASFLNRYAVARLFETVHSHIESHLSALKETLSQCSAEVETIRRNLAQLECQFSTSADAPGAEPPAADLLAAFEQKLAKRLSDQKLIAAFTAPRRLGEFRGALFAAAAETLDRPAPPAAAEESVGGTAESPLRSLGRVQSRLVLAASPDDVPAEVTDAVFHDGESPAVTCIETAGIAYADAALLLAANRPDLLETSVQLRTR